MSKKWENIDISCLHVDAINLPRNTALQTNGYGTLTSKPSHHMTMIQVLNKTIILDKQTVIILDALRKQRNIADYSGDTITESTLEECIAQAASLLAQVRQWIKTSRPELMA